MATRTRTILSPAAYEKAVADTMSVNTPMSPSQISRGIDLGSALVEKNRRRGVSPGRTAFQLWEVYRNRAAREERGFLVGGDRRTRRDNGSERTGPGFAEVQAAMRRYVKRVYGSDATVDTAVPVSSSGRGPGRGVWRAYARYPGSRPFKVEVEHRKLFPAD